MMKLLLGAALLAVPASAMAWPEAGLADPYGAHAIARGDFGASQPRLAAAVARGERTPEILLNLAAIRIGQRDRAEADALYRMVLDQPNVDLRTLSGPAWSHDIARRGLAKDATLASR